MKVNYEIRMFGKKEQYIHPLKKLRIEFISQCNMLGEIGGSNFSSFPLINFPFLNTLEVFIEKQ